VLTEDRLSHFNRLHFESINEPQFEGVSDTAALASGGIGAVHALQMLAGTDRLEVEDLATHWNSPNLAVRRAARQRMVRLHATGFQATRAGACPQPLCSRTRLETNSSPT
jgi:hypothetical protein